MVNNEQFAAVCLEGPFDKRTLDAEFVAERELLLSRGYQRLRELAGQQDVSILEYPLDEHRSG